MACNFVITHSVLTLRTEKRFSTSLTISSLKGQLHHITGTPPSKQRLQLKDPAGVLLVDNMDDDLTLGDYPTSDQCTIHVWI